jgi:hypothetical protein
MDNESWEINPTLHLAEYIDSNNLLKQVYKLLDSENTFEAARVNFQPLGKNLKFKIMFKNTH